MVMRPYEYNLHLPGVMNFHFTPHLSRLFAMVAKFFMCERKGSNLNLIGVLETWRLGKLMLIIRP